MFFTRIGFKKILESFYTNQMAKNIEFGKSKVFCILKKFECKFFGIKL